MGITERDKARLGKLGMTDITDTTASEVMGNRDRNIQDGIRRDAHRDAHKDIQDQVSARVQKAKDMAEHFHKGQLRRGGQGLVPYYDEHVLGVYNILKNECGIYDEDILITALLHDTVEDTACTLDDIDRAFGPEIREQVKLLTRIDGEPFSVYSRRLFSDGTDKTILVKLADRLHNLRTIAYMPDIQWIQKKVKQSYTDILNPLHEAMKRIHSPYNEKIFMLADKIEDQILSVQSQLKLKI